MVFQLHYPQPKPIQKPGHTHEMQEARVEGEDREEAYPATPYLT